MMEMMPIRGKPVQLKVFMAAAAILVLMLVLSWSRSEKGDMGGCAPYPERALSYYTDLLSYPLRTPDLAIDAIIRIYAARDPTEMLGVVLCKRRSPPLKLCFPGGYVEYGESVEAAVEREVLEETQLVVNRSNMRLFGVMSNPSRDKRRHTVSVAYEVFIRDGQQRPVAADDVKQCDVYSLAALSALQGRDFAFDHFNTLQMFLAQN
jgi:8-oxo-dGTP diphosphatase